MGTNYYARYDICPTCNRDKELHLGKSSAGWTFSFRGYRPNWENEQQILSEKDWKTWLRNNPHKIYDEYGKELSDEEFWEIVESKRKEKFDHYKECYGKHGASYDSQLWVDHKSGSNFSDSEFS